MDFRLLGHPTVMACWELKWKCEDAFSRGDHAEAVRLLPLVKEPHRIRDWYTLLHFSSGNGWLDHRY